MCAELSVSKGVFVHKNGFSRPSQRRKTYKKEKSIFSDKLWYQSYNSLWKTIESKLHVINSEMFSATLKDLVKFVNNSCKEKLDEIPTAALLTGINMPDHDEQFSTLTRELKENVSPHCVTLKGQDYHNLKLLIENMIYRFINDEDTEIEDDCLENEDSGESVKIKKNQCNFTVLQAWYENLYMNNSLLNYSRTSGTPKKRKTAPNRNVLVVIIPDLENFNETIIQDFILIAHSYLNILPFVLIFGVSTSLSALHKALPYHVSSKTSIKVFSSEPSIVYLNKVLENVFLTDGCPFALGGPVFSLFANIFLYYDFSVTGFVKNFKYAMMEHFSQGNVFALCSTKSPEIILEEFSDEDYDSVRKIDSFREMLREKSQEEQIKLLTDNEYLGEMVIEKISIIKEYRHYLHLFMKCLEVLVKDLPGYPLGKQVREIYKTVVSENISNCRNFQECFKLLNFQSKDEFTAKLRKIVGIIENNISTCADTTEELTGVNLELKELLQELEEIDINKDIKAGVEDEERPTQLFLSRSQLFQNLAKPKEKSKNSYEKLRERILDHLKQMFEKYLTEFRNLTFHELFFFDDYSSVRNQLIGAHRNAIHTALVDPHSYLQCSCCEINDERKISLTSPDISIAYKLHLECGKMINLYDWLTAFLTIVDSTKGDEDAARRKVDQILQARFTQAVAELEYLGFIKTSKRKTDHVQRLTWGG